MGGLLLLPGRGGTRKSAALAPRGIRFDVLENDPADAERVLRSQIHLTNRASARSGRLARASMDSLCIVARQLSRHDQDECGYDLICSDELRHLGTEYLLCRAFGDGG